ncbi:hypothetical protein VII00023_19499 [Vibrio ichthyoenteri ATCC 700023]|uniref:Uncharacterized protein n=1 Tax=Vibrio ichthyoenteri ATCC 700023 TaxID=870968 RepID=F9S3D0_9VIBR|nr:NirD/YgiW/YdeI family stress tolerance protein [Vibrio ichthyoenteri]EGU38154.1 hypothetical protein VII00023_19499 [Vibrio ichthyoenteri ATCC 700023]
MKKMITIAALILAPSIALAGDHQHDQRHEQNNAIQYNGPVALSNVATLLKESTMFTEKEVVVEGHLIRQISAETFVFSDGNAEVQVELDDDIRLQSALTATTRVRLYGEFESGRTPEIDVDRLQVL